MQKDTYGGPNLTFRFNLVPDDFGVGAKVTAEYLVSFADMPETFRGE